MLPFRPVCASMRVRGKKPQNKDPRPLFFNDRTRTWAFWGTFHILGPGKTTSSSIFVLSGSLGPWWSWFPCGLPFVSKNFPLSCQIRQSIDRSQKSFVKFTVNGANSSGAKCSFVCVTVSNNHLTHQRSQLPYLLTCPAH